METRQREWAKKNWESGEKKNKSSKESRQQAAGSKQQQQTNKKIKCSSNIINLIFLFLHLVFVASFFPLRYYIILMSMRW